MHPGFVLCLDPGETTGFAIWKDAELIDAGEIRSSEVDDLTFLFGDQYERWSEVVIEDYRVYPTKAAEHVGSRIYTVQLIGAIKLLCNMERIPFHLQGAGQAKRFTTDAKLRYWDFWNTSRHARDAIRHGVLFYFTSLSPTNRRPR